MYEKSEEAMNVPDLFRRKCPFFPINLFNSELLYGWALLLITSGVDREK